MSERLKPCPLCETDAEIIPHIVIKRVRYRAECGNDGCGCKTSSFSTVGEAVSIWNTRPSHTEAEALRAVKLALERAGEKAAAVAHSDFAKGLLSDAIRAIDAAAIVKESRGE